MTRSWVARSGCPTLHMLPPHLVGPCGCYRPSNIEGKDFHLADEIRYIQRHSSTKTKTSPAVWLGWASSSRIDAWLLDPEDHLAARLARDGDPEQIYLEETAGWCGKWLE